MSETQGGIAIAPGARAAEDWLVGQLRELCGEARRNPKLLATPVRIVVNSRGLRQHLAARLAAALGALAGVQVQTLHGLAYEVLRRAGESVRGGELVFPLYVRRVAADEAPLHEALEDKRDGYGVVVQSVSDLLDAGFEAVHRDALLEKLEQIGGNLARRGAAVFRSALQAADALEESGGEHSAAMFRRATNALGADESLLPSRAIFIHGYADATGVQADLLGALAARGAQVLVVHPPAPASAETGAAETPDPAGEAFTGRLRERLHLHLARPERAIATGGKPQRAEIKLFRAPGAWAESREAARRAAQLIHQGVAPERIAIVARDLTEHATPLRVHLRRLGVPFSGAPNAGHMHTPEAWPLHALLDLLREAEQCSADRWLDGCGWLPDFARRDLRLVLHKLGRGRLRDVAALDSEAALNGRSSLPLPVLHSAADPDEAESGGAGAAVGVPSATGGRSRRRSVPAQILREAVRRAGRACALFEGWPQALSFPAHRESLAQLCDALAWRELASKELAEYFQEKLDALQKDIGADFALNREELVLLIERATRDFKCEPLGGAGGGVQVLDVTEARRQVFDHLFLLGLNRGRFPRRFSEDPLLPDSLRLKLLELLPDIPIKSSAPDEERYLFAQLISAAPQVTLSWQEVNDDGKECNPSPLLAGLWSRAEAKAGERAPLVAGVLDAGEEAHPAPRPAHEVAAVCGAAQHANRSEHAAAMETALCEQAAESAQSAQSEEPPQVKRLAQARNAALRELDPPPGARTAQLGPFFGFVGAQVPGEKLSVTKIEALARCPWQFFLERELKLQPLPDVLAALPAVSPLDLGSLVHRILERMAEQAGVPARVNLSDIPPDAAGVALPWPGDSTLQRWLEDEAQRCGDGSLAALPGLAKLLIARAQQVLEVIRQCEWPEGVHRGVLAVEAEGAVAINAGGESGAMQLHFRADRIERKGEGLLLTDEKTGKPFWDSQAKEKGRTNQLLKGVEEGTRLQAAAYALSEGPGPAGPRSGAYFYARYDWEGQRHIEVSPEKLPALREKFGASVGALFHLLGAGAMAPRLVDEKGETPWPCQRCDVSAACSQFDTGARRRLNAWEQRAARESEAAQSGGEPLHAAEQALLGILRPGTEGDAQ